MVQPRFRWFVVVCPIDPGPELGACQVTGEAAAIDNTSIKTVANCTAVVGMPLKEKKYDFLSTFNF